MAITRRVTVDLPARLARGILESIANPHPAAAELAEAGLSEWGANLPAGDEELVDLRAGKAVQWIEGQGWVVLAEREA